MKETIKRIFYLFTTIIFIIFIVFFYFSEDNKINTNKIRSIHLAKIKENLNQLPILLNNTKNVIEYVNNFEKSKNLKTKRKFWELIDD